MSAEAARQTVGDRIASLELVVVTGKGGVGKSVVAAVLSDVLRQAGRRVLLLEVDPRETQHRLWEVPPSAGAVDEIRVGLYLQNVRAAAVVDELVEEQIRIGVVAKKVLSSTVYRHFTEGCPGLKELAVLTHARRHTVGVAKDGPTVDTVVIDAPATGHGLSLLHAPLLVSEVIEKGPVGRVTGEVAELIRDPDRSGTIVVVQAEEMPVTEALELKLSLQERVGRTPDLLVVNGLYPKWPVSAEAQLGSHPEFELWRKRRRINDGELERLGNSWSGPRLELPLVGRASGVGLVQELGVHFRAATGKVTV